jgi:hypothetical protein
MERSDFNLRLLDKTLADGRTVSQVQFADIDEALPGKRPKNRC